MITLYDDVLSANAYQVRLLLSMLAIEHTTTFVETTPGREQFSPWFRGLAPLGGIPLLDASGVLIHDSHAILVYLATAYDSSKSWYPVAAGPAVLAAITEWLDFGRRLCATAGAARLHDSLFQPTDIAASRRNAGQLLRVLDEHLWFGEQQGDEWICSLPHPTIADLACFPHIILCEEGGISRQETPAIRRWCDRIKRLPGFVVMPGVFPAG